MNLILHVVQNLSLFDSAYSCHASETFSIEMRRLASVKLSSLYPNNPQNVQPVPGQGKQLFAMKTVCDWWKKMFTCNLYKFKCLFFFHCLSSFSLKPYPPRKKKKKKKMGFRINIYVTKISFCDIFSWMWVTKLDLSAICCNEL